MGAKLSGKQGPSLGQWKCVVIHDVFDVNARGGYYEVSNSMYSQSLT